MTILMDLNKHLCAAQRLSGELETEAYGRGMDAAFAKRPQIDYDILKGRTLIKLYDVLSFIGCNTDYEGEIRALGDTVLIRSDSSPARQYLTIDKKVPIDLVTTFLGMTQLTKRLSGWPLKD